MAKKESSKVAADALNILFVASEIEPYVKTGGLADVSSALPSTLHKLGHKVKSIVPLYSKINREKYGLERVMDLACVHMGNCEEWYSVYHTNKPYGNDVYFIEFNKYFERNGIYHEPSGEYQDNPYRYAFFCRAAMQVAKDLGFKPDIIHVNDWQTCFIPYYLKCYEDPFFYDTKSVLTIHNIGYQGSFGADVLDYAKIYRNDFHSYSFESFGGINLLKGGIAYADKVTTVSPTYAREIMGPIGGGGLHEILRYKSGDLYGILNGIDTEVWNPAKDKLIPKNYDINSYKQGKKACKKAVQKMFDLNDAPNVPLFAFIGRFAAQKGLGLLAGAVENAVNNMVCQVVILGSGDEAAQWYFGGLPTRYSGQVGAYIGYDEERSHLIEAGADFFMMPSLYEPCGLNQMYSQAYGTLPIVRATGGLDDTIKQYDEATGSGTGFKFYDIDAGALYNTIGWAVSTYFDRPMHIDNMIKESMQKDFSWNKSANEYINVYKSALGR